MRKNRERDHQDWLELRFDLYKKAKASVLSYLGNDNLNLSSYAEAYESLFGKGWRASTKGSLITDIMNSDVVLLGDFHALQQSQRSHLRILKSLDRSREVVVAVECVESKFQNSLDRLMQAEIPDDEFLKVTRWHENWGFPWDHYKPIFDFCRHHRIKMVALNQRIKSRTIKTLRERDKWAAKIINSAHKATQGHQGLVLVLYGDLHLADKHLPSEVVKKNKSLKICRVFQNSESLYFQLAKKGLENKTDLLRSSRGDYCVLSVPPWVKWQNYYLYLEHQYDVGFDDQEAEERDHTDHVVSLVEFLAKFLKVKVPLDELSVYTASDEIFFEKIQQELKHADYRIVKKMVSRGRSFFIPKLKIGYLARLSVNHTAVLAADYVQAQVSSRKGLNLGGEDDFERQIWIQALIYLGSKIINHKKKTDTLEDLKQTLMQSSRHDLVGREAMQIALHQKVREVNLLNSGRLGLSKSTPAGSESLWEAARLLGGMMGERLYNGFHHKKISRERIVTFMKKSVEVDYFSNFYYEVIEFVESLPSFKSKSERL